MPNVDVTTKIELLKTSEERLGVTLGSLSAFVEEIESSYHLSVRGELNTKNGATLKSDIELIAAAYDSFGRVIGTSSHTYYLDDFFSLEIFEIFIDLPLNEISKIRLYPKRVS